MSRSKALFSNLITHIVFLAIGFVWIYPFLWMVFTSFKTEAEMFTSGLKLFPDIWQFTNFIRAWEQANFGTYFINSVIVAVMGVILCIFLNATCGYAFARHDFPGKKIFIALIMATIFIPAGYTIIPIFELIKRLGLLNTLWGIILVESGGAQAVYVLLFMSFFSQLPKELEEAAVMDGCSYPMIFLKVMLPLSKPIIATTAIFHFITCWNSFLTPLVLTVGKPNLRTLGVGMYAFVGEHSTDWTGMAAGASIALVPIIIVFLCFQRYFIEGIAGAVKG